MVHLSIYLYREHSPRNEIYNHVLMRDEKEGRNKQARSNKQQGKSHVYVNEKCRRKEEASKLIQTKQSNNLPKAVAFPKKRAVCTCTSTHYYEKKFFEVYIHVHVLVCCFLLPCCFLTLLLSSFLLHLSLNMYISLCVHVHVYQLQGIKNVLSPLPPTHPGCCCRQY